MISRSPRVNKNFTSKKAWWISQVVVLLAVRRVAHLAAQVAVQSVAHARCIQLFALSVEPKRRCHSYPRMIVPSIAARAMTRFEWHVTLKWSLYYAEISSLLIYLASHQLLDDDGVIRTKKQDQGRFAALLLFLYSRHFLNILPPRVVITNRDGDLYQQCCWFLTMLYHIYPYNSWCIAMLLITYP